MKYYLFLDESGDQNLANFNPIFPIFTLCGVIVSEENYRKMEKDVFELKQKFWNSQDTILHSRDIRKFQNNFEIFFDMEKKKEFYYDTNRIMSENDYTIVTCSILKEPYIRKYGRLGDVYGLSLSYIIERVVTYLEKQKVPDIELVVIAEMRGKSEDKNLLNYYNELLDRGTYFVNSQRIKKFFKKFDFRSKKDNIVGLQIADLAAYPIANYALSPKMVNFAFDILKPKIYAKNDKMHGLKIHP
ncbi:MAG: DUF3800 domain-containing protein [Prevotellaceae bacterium]|jgi:hypothetical protein|nr:DUF3800 domain-containing protein [Prevotellaceae bacterium]